MMLPLHDPSRRCLKLDEWPEADRVAWMKAIRKDHVLDDPGPASHWSPATLHKNRRGYGRWLTFLLDHDLVIPSQHPADRVTKEAVRDYLALLVGQGLASYTVVARIDELRTVIAAMAPDRDWQWLSDLVTRLRRRVRPVTNKRSRITPSKDLFGLGLGLMEEAGITESLKPVLRAVRFRDGLMIALLAARPLRVSNLVSIRLGKPSILSAGSSTKCALHPREVNSALPSPVSSPASLAFVIQRKSPHPHTRSGPSK